MHVVQSRLFVLLRICMYFLKKKIHDLFSCIQILCDRSRCKIQQILFLSIDTHRNHLLRTCSVCFSLVLLLFCFRYFTPNAAMIVIYVGYLLYHVLIMIVNVSNHFIFLFFTFFGIFESWNLGSFLWFLACAQKKKTKKNKITPHLAIFIHEMCWSRTVATVYAFYLWISVCT